MGAAASGKKTMTNQAPDIRFQYDARALPAVIAPAASQQAAHPGDSMGDASGGIDLFEMVAIIRRKWMVLAATLLAMLAAAALWVFSVTPLFTATSEVLITPRQKALIGGGLISPGLSSELMMIESQARIIASEAVLRRVVESEKLAADAEFNGSRPDASLRGRLRALFGMRKKKSTADPAIAALRALSKRLAVRRAEKTFVLEISVTSEDAQKAAQLANAVAAAYIADQAATKARSASRVNSLLSGRLEVLRRQVTEAEARVEDFKRKHNIVATKKDQLENEARLARLGEELVKARSRAAAAKAKYDSVKAVLAAGAPPEATWEAVNSPVISRLRADYARAAGQAASLAETLGPRHPRLLAAKAQAQRIRRLIRDELSRLARSIKAEYEAARAEVKAIERNLRRVKNSAAMTNEARVRLRELEREAKARRKVFETFLLKSKESNEAQKLQMPDARIISPAEIPVSPSWPKKKMILGLAGLLGLGLGMALALVSGLRDRRRAAPAAAGREYSPRHEMTRHDMPRQATPAPAAPPSYGLPVLAWLPALSAAHEGPPEAMFHEVHEAVSAAAGADRTAFAEAVFNILTATGGRRAIAITTPAPGHGGTTVAWALGIAASRRGRRVLLVDANRNDARLSRVLAPTTINGVRRALLGWVRPESLIVRDQQLGMDFISLSLPADFTPGRDEARAFRDWLAGLFAQYDMVIIDATPVSHAEETFDLVSLVDGVIIVASQSAAGAAQVVEAAHLVRDSGLSAGMVWNLSARPANSAGAGRGQPIREAAQ